MNASRDCVDRESELCHSSMSRSGLCNHPTVVLWNENMHILYIYMMYLFMRKCSLHKTCPLLRKDFITSLTYDMTMRN